uniref:Uncharacterized protein n=1 Tax=Avena sativa TaxID=4498 RepID=A0ACD6A7L4_AVESA
MAATNVTTNELFTKNFDLGSNDNYGSLITSIRNELGNPRHFSHNRPVLPPVEPNVPPGRWFHIKLKAPVTGAELTITTRADNLYLEGFRSSDGTWWELTRGLIPGASYVGFGGSYRDLLGDSENLSGVVLGPKKMIDAVNVLAGLTRADLASSQKQKQAKDAVAALLLMVHEATRFQSVSAFVADLMHPKTGDKSGTITKEMKAQVNGWQNLSAALLTTDAKPPGKFTPFENMGVKTVEQAAATVGILLFVEVPGGLTAAQALKLFHGN